MPGICICFRNGGETSRPIVGQVDGKIPAWLRGELLKIGPGIHEIGGQRYNYVLDGLSIIHRIRINDGVASYDSKILRSEVYKKNMKANKIVVSEFGTHSYPDPCESVFERLKTEARFVFLGDESRITDNCNVNVALHGDQVYALSDGIYIRRIDPNSLLTKGERVRIGDYAAINTATAHPHFLEDGSAIYAGSNYKSLKGPHYCFLKVPEGSENDETCFSRAKIIAEIPCRWKLHPSYFHSFGITSTGKIILVETPFCLSVPKMLALTTATKPILSLMEWHSNQTTIFHIVDIHTGTRHPILYETSNLFVLHHINAYEENGNIVVDVIGYDHPKMIMELFEFAKTDVNSRKPCFPTSRRYVLPLKSVTGSKRVVVVPSDLSSDFLELPHINSKFNGRKYRYFYAAGVPGYDSPMELGRYITKVDLYGSNTRTFYDLGDDLRGSEPIFVANPTLKSPSEDDGVVLSVVLSNQNPNYARLLILDAKRMTEIGIVGFDTDDPVSFLLHGTWKA